jgi:hypothetical protein
LNLTRSNATMVNAADADVTGGNDDNVFKEVSMP